MQPEQSPELVCIFHHNQKWMMPREKIAAAYAGAYASWEQIANEESGVALRHKSFAEQYQEIMPACIFAANELGSATTVNLMEEFHPGKVTSIFCKISNFRRRLLCSL